VGLCSDIDYMGSLCRNAQAYREYRPFSVESKSGNCFDDLQKGSNSSTDELDMAKLA